MSTFELWVTATTVLLLSSFDGSLFCLILSLIPTPSEATFKLFVVSNSSSCSIFMHFKVIPHSDETASFWTPSAKISLQEALLLGIWPKYQCQDSSRVLSSASKTFSLGDFCLSKNFSWHLLMYPQRLKWHSWGRLPQYMYSVRDNPRGFDLHERLAEEAGVSNYNPQIRHYRWHVQESSPNWKITLSFIVFCPLDSVKYG